MAHFRNRSLLAVSLASSAALVLSACSSSDGSSTTTDPASILDESEPNNSAAAAPTLALDRPGAGSIDGVGDMDWWAISLTEGQTVQVELFGARMDQATWEAAQVWPAIALYRDANDPPILYHNADTEWGWGDHDLDIPVFRAPATDTYYVMVHGTNTIVEGGEYAIVASEITLANEQFEAEGDGITGANDTTGTAEALVAGTMIGFHVDDESDFYSFTTVEPTWVSFELKSYRNGVWNGDDEMFDTELRLHDGGGVLAANDDAYFYDSAIQYWIETPGTYFVEVTECCGNGDARYFLEFSTLSVAAPVAETEANDTSGTAQPVVIEDIVDCDMTAADTDFLSFDGVAGDMVFVQVFEQDNRDDAVGYVTVEWYGPDGSTPIEYEGEGELQTWRTVLQQDGTYFLEFAFGSGSDTNYSVHITRFRATTQESEPNDDDVNAGAFDVNDTAAGAIATAGDEDWYSFTATGDRLVTISCFASNDYTQSNGFEELSDWGSELDPKLEILDSTLATLATSLSDGPDTSTEGVVDGLASSNVTFKVPSTGTYFVRVTSVGGNFGDDMYYTLKKR